MGKSAALIPIWASALGARPGSSQVGQRRLTCEILVNHGVRYRVI